MSKFFGIKRHKMISPEKIYHNEEGKGRQVKKLNSSNSKSETGLWRLWGDFQTFFHEQEEIVPRVKDDVASEGAQVIEKGFPCA